MMMLKSIPDSKPFELNLLAEYEAYFFIFIAVLLIIVLIKTKIFGKFYKNNPSKLDIQDGFEFESRDILMQPKKSIDEDKIPFISYSLNWVYIGFAVLFIIAFCSIYP